MTGCTVAFVCSAAKVLISLLHGISVSAGSQNAQTLIMFHLNPVNLRYSGFSEASEFMRG